jgi:mannose/fructose/N-acetylgalactosamine-specific phosphotransferase system component IIB
VTLALARVDDRLVHGQVVLAWGPALRAVRLLVVDDEVAANPWERDLLRASAGELEVRVLSVAEAPPALREETGRAGAAIVLFRSPRTALAAVEGGAALAELNLGGLHYAPGRERVLDYVYLDAADRRSLAALVQRGVRLTAQDVPSSRPVDASPWADESA